MAYFRRTPENYALLVQAFRKHGKNFKAVGAEVDCDPRIAKNVWLEGWKKSKGDGAIIEDLRPISELLKDSAVDYGGASKAATYGHDHTIQPTSPHIPAPTPTLAPNSGHTDSVTYGHDHTPAVELAPPAPAAPAAPASPVAAALAAVQASIPEALSEEATIMAAARNNALGLQAVSQQVLITLSAKLAPALDTMLTRLQLDGNLSPSKLVDMLREVGRVMGESTRMAQTLMEMLRLQAGVPQRITEERGASMGRSEEDRERDLKRLGHVLTLLQRRPKGEPSAYAGEEQGVIDVEVAPPQGAKPE